MVQVEVGVEENCVQRASGSNPPRLWGTCASHNLYPASPSRGAHPPCYGSGPGCHIYLYVCMYVCMFLSIYMYLSIYLSIYLCIYLSVDPYLSIYLFIYSTFQMVRSWLGHGPGCRRESQLAPRTPPPLLVRPPPLQFYGSGLRVEGLRLRVKGSRVEG